MKPGVLAVSFGAVHMDTLEKTARTVEAGLSAGFPGCRTEDVHGALPEGRGCGV